LFSKDGLNFSLGGALHVLLGQAIDQRNQLAVLFID